MVVLLWLCTSLPWLTVSMRMDRLAQLRQDTVDMFYHGFSNYMKHAFPEDEVWQPSQAIPDATFLKKQLRKLGWKRKRLTVSAAGGWILRPSFSCDCSFDLLLALLSLETAMTLRGLNSTMRWATTHSP